MKHICELSFYCGKVRSRDIWPGGCGVLCGKGFYIHKKCGLSWHFWENSIVEAKESQLDVCTNVQDILLYFFFFLENSIFVCFLEPEPTL